MGGGDERERERLGKMLIRFKRGRRKWEGTSQEEGERGKVGIIL